MSFSNINYNLYKVFIVVYECKNITRASKELVIGQPNVSRSIKELERQLGVKLFHASPRGVEATSEGRELYYKIAPALAWIDYGEKSIKEFTESSIGVIKINIATNFAGHYLVPFICEFNKKYPYIQFEILNKPIEMALEMLGRNRIDLVLSSLPINDKGEFEKVVLAELNEVGIASKSFSQTHGINDVISEQQFQSLPYISLSSVESRKRPNIIVGSQDLLIKFVKKDLGVGFCAEEFIDVHYPGEVVKFTVKDAKMAKWNLSCVYNKDYLSKVTDVFLNLIRTYQKQAD